MRAGIEILPSLLMAEKTESKKRLLDRLKSHFRLVIMNEETFEETASFKLRPLNVFVTTGVIIILLITITTFIIAFTPLREYIPGYSDVKMKRRVIDLMMKTDSMERALQDRERYIANIRNVVNGDFPDSTEASQKIPAGGTYDTIHKLHKSPADSMLRQQMEMQDRYSLAIEDRATNAHSMSGFFFFPPVKGTITNRFDPVTKHFGIDIVAKANEGIKATLDGTVVISNFTSETGYVIGIQHSNNLFSFYKHNSALLRKVGEYVKAGDVIAIIGNSGELSEGSHLHFELWLNGNPINPQQYVSF